MKLIKRFFIFIAIVGFWVIIREVVQLTAWLYGMNPWAGHIGLGVLVTAFIYFAVIPMIKILLMPVYPPPVQKSEDEEKLIRKRLHIIPRNHAIENNVDIRQSYQDIISELQDEVQKIRKKYVTEVFYSTSIAQNGFLDALFILSAAIRMIREIFILYQGRVSNKDLWLISKKIYMAMLVGGSEGVEYAAHEIFSRLSVDSMKSIPFMDKLVGSLADGFVNAAMLTRISMVTENYCSMTLVKDEQVLVPTVSSVAATTKFLIGDMTARIRKTVTSMVVEKSVDYARLALNPAAFVLDKSLQVATKTKDLTITTSQYIKLGISLAVNPLYGGMQKLYTDFLKRKPKSTH